MKHVFLFRILTSILLWKSFFSVGVSGDKNFNFQSLRRIVNGVYSEHLPFYAFLTFPSNGAFGFCGGSVISPWVVLTAAHCLLHENTQFNPSNIEVNYGTVDRIRMKKVGAIGAVVHKDFQRIPVGGGERVVNDIAVIIMERPLTANENVQPISLGEAPAPGGQVWAAGYGSRRQRGEYEAESGGSQPASDLLKVDLQVVANDVCASFVNDRIEYNQICGLEKGRNICQGDSGGPLYTVDQNGYSHIVGITSTAYGCAAYKKPAVFTRVSAFYDWIMDKVNNHHNYVNDQLLLA